MTDEDRQKRLSEIRLKVREAIASFGMKMQERMFNSIEGEYEKWDNLLYDETFVSKLYANMHERNFVDVAICAMILDKFKCSSGTKRKE